MSCGSTVMYQPYSSYGPSQNEMQSFGQPSVIPSATITSASVTNDNNNTSSNNELDTKHHIFKVEEHLQSVETSYKSTPPRTTSPNGPSRSPSQLSESSDSIGSDGHVTRLSGNVIIFNNYNGDVRNVVDDHFSRALNYNESSDIKNKPMSARNLPASFWSAPSSTYSSSRAFHVTGQSYAELYGDPSCLSGALHQLAAAADWQYNSSGSSGSHGYSSRPPSHYNYGRLHQSGSYWASRLGSAVKNEWSSGGSPGGNEYSSSAVAALQHGGDFSHHYHPHHYPNVPGLDGSELKQDFYWPSF